MGKGFIFIGIALFIDGLQAFMDWAFLALGGALALPTFGAAVPLGIAIGFAVNFVISATFGVMLIVGLGMFGFLKKGDLPFVGGMGLFEIIPGLDCLPGWTLMTVRCVMKAQAKQVVATAITSVTKLATNDNTPPAANDNIPRVGQEVYA